MSEDRGQEVPVAAMRRQADDNVKIRVSLGGIIDEMTREKDEKGLKRIKALYGEEIFNKAVDDYRAS